MFSVSEKEGRRHSNTAACTKHKGYTLALTQRGSVGSDISQNRVWRWHIGATVVAVCLILPWVGAWTRCCCCCVGRRVLGSGVEGGGAGGNGPEFLFWSSRGTNKGMTQLRQTGGCHGCVFCAGRMECVNV